MGQLISMSECGLPSPAEPCEEAPGATGTFVMVGASHRSAPLELLERLSIRAAELPAALQSLAELTQVTGVIALSTCNRTELYASCERFHDGVEQLATFLATRADVAVSDLAPSLSILHDDTALHHLFRVAAGAESVMLGETEILGQLQRALASAETHGVASPIVARALRHAVGVGRRARAETGVAAGSSSLPWLAVQRAGSALDGLRHRHVLVFGAGEMGGGVAAAVAKVGAAEITIAGRSTDRAAAVAAAVGGRAVAGGELANALEAADAVFTATNSSEFVVPRRTVSSVMARRPDRPLVIVDLALPRDVDPDVVGVPGVTLVDLDDLRTLAAEALDGRRQHLPAVERLVTEEVDRFLRETRARDIAPLVSALRCRVEDVRKAELRRWQARSGRLDPQALALADAITAGVIAKLLHGPTVRLKEAAGTADADVYRAALTDLFELGEPTTRLA
jgi:glutamyl-tRNA reductase